MMIGDEELAMERVNNARYGFHALYADQLHCSLEQQTCYTVIRSSKPATL